MTTKEALEQILVELPENRLGEVVDFARFLCTQGESEAWRQFGRAQLAKAYGNGEPEYNEAILNRSLINEARRCGPFRGVLNLRTFQDRCSILFS